MSINQVPEPHNHNMLQDLLELLELAEQLLDSVKKNEKRMTRICVLTSTEFVILLSMIYIFIRNHNSIAICALAITGATVETIAIIRLLWELKTLYSRTKNDSESIRKTIALIRETKATVLDAAGCSPIFKERIRVRVEQFDI